MHYNITRQSETRRMKMTGQVIGYVRVSSDGQNLDRQEAALGDAGRVDRIFRDKTSGKNTRRPGLQECLGYLRAGDTWLVPSIDRAARSLQDLQTMVQDLTGRGVTVRFLKEGLTFGGDDGSAMDRLLFQILGAFAEFERTLIHERQAEGIRAARAKGVRFGRRPALSCDQIPGIKDRIEAGESMAAIAEDLGVSRQTIWRAARA
jgi:DNA invertase Pin-like site-specific DNA recombinase